MSKPRRGRNAKKIENWRGTCPVCSRKRVKLLWSAVVNDNAIKVCKHCGKVTKAAA